MAMRSHYCGLVTEALLGQTVSLCGWQNKCLAHENYQKGKTLLIGNKNEAIKYFFMAAQFDHADAEKELMSFANNNPGVFLRRPELHDEKLAHVIKKIACKSQNLFTSLSLIASRPSSEEERQKDINNLLRQIKEQDIHIFLLFIEDYYLRTQDISLINECCNTLLTKVPLRTLGACAGNQNNLGKTWSRLGCALFAASYYRRFDDGKNLCAHYQNIITKIVNNRENSEDE